MDPRQNPFAPGAGSQPPELTGRLEMLQQADIALQRIKAGRHAKSFIAVGLRGVGKTVLLNRIREIAEGHGYRTVQVEAHEDKPLAELLAPHLRRVLLELDRLGALNATVKRSLSVFKSFLSSLKLKYGEAELALDIEPEAGSADSGDLEADLPELFAAIGRAARERGVPVVLLIDEIQYLKERDMSALIMALHRVSQNALPMLMVAVGLPQVVGLSGRSKSYAERLFDFPSVDALTFEDAERALAIPVAEQNVAFQPEALQTIIRTTQGYPYFLQAWGYQVWNAAASSPITLADIDRATPKVMTNLDESFFRVRFDRLTTTEKTYLRAMAELGTGPYRSGDIATKLDRKVTSLGPLRNGLIHKGMIYSPAHGDTAFTVPLFDAFLRRIMPEFQAPPRAQS
jgi:hypothetical protein